MQRPDAIEVPVGFDPDSLHRLPEAATPLVQRRQELCKQRTSSIEPAVPTQNQQCNEARTGTLGPMGKEGQRKKHTFEGAEVAVVRRLEEHAPLLAAGCSAARRSGREERGAREQSISK